MIKVTEELNFKFWEKIINLLFNMNAYIQLVAMVLDSASLELVT